MSLHKVILFLLSLCATLPATAQTGGYRSASYDAGKNNPFKRVTFTIDTIAYEQHSLARQRAPREDLTKMIPKGNGIAIRQLIDLQDALDKKDANTANTDIDNIASLAPGFDLSVYRQEAAAYQKAGSDREAAQKHIKDSTSIALQQQNKEQQERDEKLQKANATIIKNFGSMDEFMHQGDIYDNSTSKRRIPYVGYKINWYAMLTGYMETFMGCKLPKDANDDLVKEPEGDDGMKITVMSKGKPLVLHFKATNDAIPITTKVTINGDPASLISLFLGYWEINDIDKATLKKGALVMHDFVSDRITFNWKTAAPSITITANPAYHGYMPAR